MMVKVTKLFRKFNASNYKLTCTYGKTSKGRPAWIRVKGLPKERETRFIKVDFGKKGQVSTEYLFLLGMLLIIFIPVIIFSFTKVNQEIRDAQLEELVLKLQQSANAIHFLGTGSQEVIDVNIPSTVTGIAASNIREITLQMESVLESDNQAAANVSIPVSPYVLGKFSAEQGSHRLVVWAFNSTHVNITDVIYR